MNKPCRALIFTVVVVCAAVSTWADEYPGGVYKYDARIAFLKAGELDLELNRYGAAYEVQGQYKTSRAMSTYYTWNGLFAARGVWEAAGPVTKAYMARTLRKDERLKVVVNSEAGVRLLDRRGGEFKSVEKPGGIDLISALFFNPGCYRGGMVHDGEDPYRLELLSEKPATLRSASDKYFEGEVTHCDYAVRDHKDRKRRVVVSLAEVGETTVAVQVRVKIPVLPDVVFRLRVPAQPPAPQAVIAARTAPSTGVWMSRFH